MGKSQVNVLLSEEQIAKLDRMCIEIPGLRPASTRPKLCSWLLGSAIDAAPEPDRPKLRKIVARPFPSPGQVDSAKIAASRERDDAHEGGRLRAARIAAELTHEELAVHVGGERPVSRGQVQRAERAASLDGYPALRAWLAGQEAKP